MSRIHFLPKLTVDEKCEKESTHDLGAAEKGHLLALR
jgi:hypothetical protein